MNKKVLLLLPQGFEEYEAAVFTDILGWSREYETEHVHVDSVAVRDEIQCTFNLRVKAQYLLHEINPDEYDGLAIPGGYEEAGFYEDAWSEPVLDLVRLFHSQKKPIALVCVAALIGGKAGILNGRRATTYHLGGVRREQLAQFGAVVEDKRLVVDDNVITCTGPGAAADVAFELLEMVTSRETRELIWHKMGFDL